MLQDVQLKCGVFSTIPFQHIKYFYTRSIEIPHPIICVISDDFDISIALRFSKHAVLFSEKIICLSIQWRNTSIFLTSKRDFRLCSWLMLSARSSKGVFGPLYISFILKQDKYSCRYIYIYILGRTKKFADYG